MWRLTGWKGKQPRRSASGYGERGRHDPAGMDSPWKTVHLEERTSPPMTVFR